MKKLLLIGVSLLAACSSTSGPEATHASGALIYFKSQRSVAGISNCLQRRLPASRLAGAPHGVTELGIERAWRITLTPTASGSIVAVHKEPGSTRVPEPELRFALARCTT